MAGVGRIQIQDRIAHIFTAKLTHHVQQRRIQLLLHRIGAAAIDIDHLSVSTHTADHLAQLQTQLLHEALDLLDHNLLHAVPTGLVQSVRRGQHEICQGLTRRILHVHDLQALTGLFQDRTVALAERDGHIRIEPAVLEHREVDRALTDVDTDGILKASYTNNQTVNIAKLAVVGFEAPDNLESVSNTMFRANPNCGDSYFVEDNVVQPNALETSTASVEEEFSNMVVIQRAYSLNAQSFTVADEMLQEAVNIKT